jgi:hypothetical protein
MQLTLYKMQFKDTPGRKKRRKSGGSSSTEQYDLIAVGTTAGSILIYSIVKGDVKTIMVCIIFKCLKILIFQLYIVFVLCLD